MVSIGLDQMKRAARAWSIAFESQNKAGRTVIPAMVGISGSGKIVHLLHSLSTDLERSRLYTNEDRNSSLTVPMMTCRAESLERGGVDGHPRCLSRCAAISIRCGAL
jgi:hypothetical protein